MTKSRKPISVVIASLFGFVEPVTVEEQRSVTA